jgi:hypothetical protein
VGLFDDVKRGLAVTLGSIAAKKAVADASEQLFSREEEESPEDRAKRLEREAAAKNAEAETARAEAVAAANAAKRRRAEAVERENGRQRAVDDELAALKKKIER